MSKDLDTMSKYPTKKKVVFTYSAFCLKLNCTWTSEDRKDRAKAVADGEKHTAKKLGTHETAISYKSNLKCKACKIRNFYTLDALNLHKQSHA